MAIVTKKEAGSKSTSTKNAKADKPAKKAGSKKAGSKKAGKAKAEKLATDAYGSRVGSQAAAINAAMAKPIEAAKLAEKVGLPLARVRLHLRWLKDRKLMKEEKDGKVVGTPKA